MPLFHRPKPSDTMVSIPCIVPLRDRAERRQENRELAVGPPWFPAELPGFLAEMSRCHLLSLYGQRVELYLQAELHERHLSGLQGRAGVCWGMVAVPSMAGTALREHSCQLAVASPDPSCLSPSSHDYPGNNP